MSDITAVVFDWAGTVVDFGCVAPVRALEAAFADEGIKITEAQARKDMGKAKRDHIAALIANPDVVGAWLGRYGVSPAGTDVDRIYEAVGPLMLKEATRCSTLIPGAAEVVDWLQKRGVKIGSSTGYTRAMMQGILPRAASQGYAPSVVVCADDTKLGRPSPLPMWKALSELAAYPAWHTVKVDDSVVGIEEGRAAGSWTIGISASGNGVGLSLEDWQALPESEQKKRAEAAALALRDAGADYVIATIADAKDIFIDIERRIAHGERPKA